MIEKTVFLYVTDTMADWEAGHAIAHLNKSKHQREPGRFTVETVAATSAPIRTMGGVTIVPDTTFEGVVLDETAMLILPGADTWAETRRHDAALATARSLLEAGVPVAAICGATFGLALAGLLDDRDHTSNAAVYLEMSGYAGAARYREEKSVTDRGLITAGGTDPVDFAVAIFAALDLYEPQVLEAWHGLYRTGELEYFLALNAG